MYRSNQHCAIGPSRTARRLDRAPRRGVSVVLVLILLVALIGFVSLAVDIGRVKWAKAQLQTAADSAAFAGASALPAPNATQITEVEDRAVLAAAENPNLDTDTSSGRPEETGVVMLPDQDVEFGVWHPETREFKHLESVDGGTDERREANAVRTWGRRVTQYLHKDSLGATQTITRNDGLKLILAPVLPNGRKGEGAPMTGEIQTLAVAYAKADSQTIKPGFVGLQGVFFNGTTKTDSYSAKNGGTYPADPNQAHKNSSIASNEDIHLVGTTDIWGDVRPGVNGSILDYPLGDNVTVTGAMNPLSKDLDYPITAWLPPTNSDNAATSPDGSVKAINPALPKKAKTAFAPTQDTTLNAVIGTSRPTDFLFTSWTTGNKLTTKINNSTGPIRIFVNGNFTNGAQAQIHITSNTYPVTMYINGDFDMEGGGITNDGGKTDSTVQAGVLTVNVTKANTRVDIGGSPVIGMHLYAPGSDITLHGDGGKATSGFFGWAIGKTFTVTGNMAAHYDESFLDQNQEGTYHVHLVQ